jgi:hypothetical protein
MMDNDKQLLFTTEHLYEVIEMYLEYVYVHGYEGIDAKQAAVREMIEGRSAEVENAKDLDDPRNFNLDEFSGF